MLESLRGELAKRGARGIIGLQRKFRIIDDNGDRVLSLGEFNKAMKECGLNLSQEEVMILFKKFDSDNSGGVDFDEFLVRVRVSMLKLTPILSLCQLLTKLLILC